MHTYTNNPYEISTPTTPRDEASSSNQQLINAQKTPDRPTNMRRVTTRTRVKLDEKLLSATQEAAFIAAQEVLKKQDIKRKANLALVQIEEEEKRALIISEAMQQAVQIEKQAQESARTATKTNTLTLMTQDNIQNNKTLAKKALQHLQRNHYNKTTGINLAYTPSRSVFLPAKYLEQPCLGTENQKPCPINNENVRLSQKHFPTKNVMNTNSTPSRSIFLSAEHLQHPCVNNQSYNPFWTKVFLMNNPQVSNNILKILQNDYRKTSSTLLKY